MKDNRKTYLIVLLCSVVFLVLMGIANRPEQRWETTWSSLDKEPFGGYVTHDLMRDMFPGQEIRSEYRTLYEILKKDSLNAPNASLMIVTNNLALDQNDWNAVVSYMMKGHDVLISAQLFSGRLADSLDISVDVSGGDDFSLTTTKTAARGESTVKLKFTTPGFPSDEFDINYEASANYFEKDTGAYVSLAENEFGNDVLRQYTFGEGHLYLSSTPVLLTNYYMLDSSSREFAAGLISTLPAHENLIHIEYYSVGRLQAQTPMRYILSHPALKMAFWLTMTGILLFLVFESRRRQRIIPVLEPPANTSLEFVRTLGQLYYTSGENHLNLAKKRMNYFMEYVRRHYYIATNELDEDFVKELALKSGRNKTRIEKMVKLFNRIKKGEIDQAEFLLMEKWLRDFYKTKYTDKQKNQ